MKISKDAQAVIFQRKNQEDMEFLVLERFDKEKSVDHFRLVKGGIKKTEDGEQAIRREIIEELGFKNINIIGKLGEYQYVSNEVLHKVEAYLVELLDSSGIALDSLNEGGFTIKDAAWANFDKAVNLLTFPIEKEMIKLAIWDIKKMN